MSAATALGTERFSGVRAEVHSDEHSRRLLYSFCVRFSKALATVWGLLACKCVILVVSGFDIYLTVKYVEFLPELELNPIGRWLLGVDSGPRCQLQDAAAFITAKFAGNVLVLAIIEALAQCNFRMVGCVAGAVALFQLLLGIFLLFADLRN